MTFVKGISKVPGSGRKKGTTNKVKVSKVREVLAELGIDPVREIIEILQNGDLNDRARAEMYLELQSYCEAKPKENDDKVSGAALVDGAFDGMTDDEIMNLRIVGPDEVP